MLMHYILIKLKILFDVIKMYSIYFITLHLPGLYLDR